MTQGLAVVESIQMLPFGLYPSSTGLRLNQPDGLNSLYPECPGVAISQQSREKLFAVEACGQQGGDRGGRWFMQTGTGKDRSEHSLNGRSQFAQMGDSP